MTKQTDSEALGAVLAKLDQVVDASEGSAALLVRLDAIDKRGEETVDLLRMLNGSVQENGKQLAAHGQWIESHQEITHPALVNQIEGASRRTNAIEAVTGALALIAVALGIRPE